MKLITLKKYKHHLNIIYYKKYSWSCYLKFHLIMRLSVASNKKFRTNYEVRDYFLEKKYKN